MSHDFYRLAHLFGFLMLFIGLSAVWAIRSQGALPGVRLRAYVASLHGVGLTLLIVTGIMMLMQLGYNRSVPNWAIVKFVIWLYFGASLTLIKKKAKPGFLIPTTWIVIAGFAAYLCIYKPF